MLPGYSGSVQDQRDLAASAQLALERLVAEKAQLYLSRFPSVDGVVLTGDVGLNVRVNSAVQRAVGVPVHVPPSPGDAGLVIGAVWAITPPKRLAERQQHARDRRSGSGVQHLGLAIEDVDMLANHGAAHPNATRLQSAAAAIPLLAELLAGGAVIGVMRGRQEVGPRALGHRSLLAIPAAGMKRRMHRLKDRDWYHPIAPVLAAEAVTRAFEREVFSPYMSFADTMRPEMADEAPAVYHFDGSARPQTVQPGDDKWLHELLRAVGNALQHSPRAAAGALGMPMLINTSLNSRGRPIVNRIDEALRMLTEIDDLDYIYVQGANQGWLFGSGGGQAMGDPPFSLGTGTLLSADKPFTAAPPQRCPRTTRLLTGSRSQEFQCDRSSVITVNDEQFEFVANEVSLRDEAKEFCRVHGLDAERDGPQIESHFQAESAVLGPPSTCCPGLGSHAQRR